MRRKICQHKPYLQMIMIRRECSTMVDGHGLDRSVVVALNCRFKNVLLLYIKLSSTASVGNAFFLKKPPAVELVAGTTDWNLPLPIQSGTNRKLNQSESLPN